MKTFYKCLMLGIVLVSGVASATGIPTRGRGEIINIVTDKNRSNDDYKIIETHSKMMDEVMDVIGGPESFSSENAKSALEETLLPVTDTITGVQNGLEDVIKNISGKALKPCGGNAEDFMKELDKQMSTPTTKKQRESLTQTQLQTLMDNQKKAVEKASTAGLARAWIAEMEASDVAESFAILPDEFGKYPAGHEKAGQDKIDSQMDAMIQILRLQEEAYKNLNTRTSLMADDLKNTGLSALENNM